ncbi:MAG: hypothetical protein ACLGI8_03740 [Acidimicrobiia bacterium]|jgi:hypothetical protein
MAEPASLTRFALLVGALAAAGLLIVATLADHETARSLQAAGSSGDPLPDGLEVSKGTELVAPLGRGHGWEGLDGWIAVAKLTGRPLDVWQSLLEQLVEVSPNADIQPDRYSGCLRTPDYAGQPPCQVLVPIDGTEPRMVAASLVAIDGDITGRHLLVIGGGPNPGVGFDDHGRAPEDWNGDELAAEVAAREAPGVGDPLAPETVAYPGDDDRYVLLEGSVLLAQFGEGSLTGGFDVVLGVEAGVDPVELGARYAAQAAEFEGETRVETFVEDGITYTTFRPPGGAGGYSGVITVVEDPKQPTIYYSLAND